MVRVSCRNTGSWAVNSDSTSCNSPELTWSFVSNILNSRWSAEKTATEQVKLLNLAYIYILILEYSDQFGVVVFFSGNQNNNSDAGGYNNRRTPPHRRYHQVAVNQHAVIRRSYTPSPATSHESSPGPPDPQGRRPSPTLPLGQTQPSMDTENIKKIGNYYECTICGARSTSTAEMGKHSQGRRHRLGVVTAELKKQRSDTELHL